MENRFSQLYQINVSDHVEKKNGLSYLSWAWAWAELKKLYPDATYTVYEDENGCFYHTDGRTCWVKTGVTVEGLEHIEYLPVMDHRNRSIPLEQVDSFSVNRAIQRSLTKAVARHGLGLYIYAGEDLPEDADEKPAEKPDKEKRAEKQEQQEETAGHKLRRYLARYKKLSGLTETEIVYAIKSDIGLDLNRQDLTDQELLTATNWVSAAGQALKAAQAG